MQVCRVGVKHLSNSIRPLLHFSSGDLLPLGGDRAGSWVELTDVEDRKLVSLNELDGLLMIGLLLRRESTNDISSQSNVGDLLL